MPVFKIILNKVLTPPSNLLHYPYMNNANMYQIKKTPVEKVSVTVTRKQLWNNFIKVWAEQAWDNYCGTEHFTKVANVLLNGEPVSNYSCQCAIRNLFQDGYTVLLLDGAMDELDPDSRQVLREVIIIDSTDINDGTAPSLIIHHEDINY